MERNDVEGAIGAAQYFLELYPYAYNTGDLKAWREMSHPECIFCASVIKNVEELHADGRYELGGELVFERVSARDPLPGSEYFAVDFDLEQKSGTRVNTDGSRNEFEGERSVARFAIGRTSEGWQVREVTVETQR